VTAAPSPSSKNYALLDSVPENARTLGVLASEEEVLAVMSHSEDQSRGYHFSYVLDGVIVAITAETSLELAILVGDRWLKTEELDKIDEDNMSLIVGVLSTFTTKQSFSVISKNGVVEVAD
jgi:hypothetical protein